jgi:hypothetical protein
VASTAGLGFNAEPYWEINKSFSLETKTSLTQAVHEWPFVNPCKFGNFVWIRKCG